MFKSVIGMRLIGLLLAGILISFGLLTFLIYQREKAQMTMMGKNEAAIVAKDAVSHFEDLAKEGRQDDIKQILARENSHGDVSVAIFKGDGSLYYGKAAFPMPAGIPAASKDGTFIESGGQYAYFKTVFNCLPGDKCDGPSSGVRGVVAAYVSDRMCRAEGKATLKRMLAFIAVTAFASILGVVMATRKIIIKPLASLRDGVRRASGGDFDHEIEIKGKDEISELAVAFNNMSRKVGHFQKHLTDEIARQTKDLQTIARVSAEAFRSDQALNSIIESALGVLTSDLGCDYYCFAIFDRETGLFTKEYHRNMNVCPFPKDISTQREDPFARIVLNLAPQVVSAETAGLDPSAGQIAVVPVLSYERRRCRVINKCIHEKCPAFDSPDERCWLQECTMCGSFYSDNRDKLSGCLVCPAFPMIGVLMAGKAAIDSTTLSSMEILASGIAAAIENCHLMEKQKKDIEDLVNLYDLSMQNFLSLDSSDLPAAIVRSAVSLSGMDSAALWTNTGGVFDLKASFKIDSKTLPVVLDAAMLPEVPRNGKLIEFKELPSLFSEAAQSGDFKYICLVPVRAEERKAGWLALFKKKHILMPEAEKAIMLLYASQAASALEAVRLYKALQGSVLALSEEKEFSDAVFNSAASGVLALDNEGKILRLNRSGADILEIKSENAVGLPLVSINQGLGKMLGVENATREFMFDFPGGRSKPIGFVSSPILDSSGMKCGDIIVFRDLTELKKLQAEISKKQHFESMGKVISGVAHEIRNPLFAIQSIGQLLEREISSPEHQALIGAMLKETTRMKTLVEELLLYSRPSRLNKIDINLDEFIEELRSRYRLKGMDRLISAQTESDIIFKADKDKLTQVFINLVQNAVEAGAKKVELMSRKANGSFEILIKDDGPGLGAGYEELVFDPFFTTKKEGTGLGLPICKKLIEEHGGSLTLKNGPAGVEVLIRLNL